MVVSKENAEKKTPAKKSPVKKTVKKEEVPTLEKVVQENVRHIEENTQEIRNNSNMIHLLYGIIIVLLLIIAGLAFYVGSKMGWGNARNVAQAKDIEVTILDDIRCKTCQTDTLKGELEKLPFLAGASFVKKDFSEKGIQELMKENDIKMLPAVIFNTNLLTDGGNLTNYLTPLSSGEGYNLALPSTFDPFLPRSENGFLFLNQEKLAQVQEWLSFTGATEPKFLWIEFSDLGCSACKQFHSSGIEAQAFEKHGNVMAKALVGFLTVWGQASADAMEAIECMAEQNESLHHTAWTNFYKTGNFGNEELKKFAEENGVNITEYQACLDGNSMVEKIETQKQMWVDVFGISGTPGNIILNRETGEYENASWSIVETLDAMMK